MRFLGNIEAKTDAKGRVFFPSAMRKVLQSAGEELLVMRKDVHQACLVLYPESVWNQQMDEARQKLNRWDAQEQLLFRQFVMNVEFISLDGHGRFLIPKRYLQMAGIEQSVHFIGMGDCIEIWASQHLEKPFIEAEEFGRLFGERMSAPTDTNLSNSDKPW
jgi:MraZ protein